LTSCGHVLVWNVPFQLETFFLVIHQEQQKEQEDEQEEEGEPE
jgi:hypothetical protein